MNTLEPMVSFRDPVVWKTHDHCYAATFTSVGREQVRQCPSGSRQGSISITGVSHWNYFTVDHRNSDRAVYTHTHTRTRTRTNAHTYTHARTHARTHAHARTHTHTYAHVRYKRTHASWRSGACAWWIARLVYREHNPVPDDLRPVHSSEYTPPLPFSARCSDENGNSAIMQVVCGTKAVWLDRLSFTVCQYFKCASAR